jgi:hypothetical protein
MSETSEQTSGFLPRILIGVAIGAAALVIYNRRGIFGGVSGPQLGAQLPEGERIANADGTPVPRSETIQFEPVAPRAAGASAGGAGSSRVAGITSTISASVTRASSTAVQKAQGVFADGLAPIQRYIDSARAQLDVAIAEGQAQAARTRTELEARFEEAKRDPSRGRSAFM